MPDLTSFYLAIRRSRRLHAQIDGFEPTVGAPGDTVRIRGLNFDTIPPPSALPYLFRVALRFGNSSDASRTYISPTELEAVIPPDATSGLVVLDALDTPLPRDPLDRLDVRREAPPVINRYVIAQSPGPFIVLPVAPTSLVATALGANGIRLDWSYTGVGHAGFHVFYTEDGGPWTSGGRVLADARTTWFYDALASTAYQFRISAVGADGFLSNPSNTASTVTEAAPTVSIELGKAPSPFQDAGPVAEIVSFRSYFDSSGDGVLNAAPFNSNHTYFPRSVPPLGEPGAGYPQAGNVFVPGSNAVVVIAFRTSAGRPVQYAAIPCNITAVAANGQVVQGPMYAGDHEVTGKGAVIMVQMKPPAQVVGQPVAGVLAGNVTANVTFEVPNPVPGEPGTVHAASVTVGFSIAVEPEELYS